MYKVISGNRVQSDPLDTDTLAQWIRELRIGPSTRLIDTETGQTVRAGTVAALQTAFALQAQRTRMPDAPAPKRRGWVLPGLILAALLGGYVAYDRGRDKPALNPLATDVPQSGAQAPSAAPEPRAVAVRPLDPAAPAQAAAAPTQGAGAPTRKTHVSNAALRSAPSRRAPHLKILREGTPVTILGERGAYYKVRMARGTEGWLVKWALPKPPAPRPAD